jgi:hypothetical protein
MFRLFFDEFKAFLNYHGFCFVLKLVISNLLRRSKTKLQYFTVCIFESRSENFGLLIFDLKQYFIDLVERV